MHLVSECSTPPGCASNRLPRALPPTPPSFARLKTCAGSGQPSDAGHIATGNTSTDGRLVVGRERALRLASLTACHSQPSTTGIADTDWLAQGAAQEKKTGGGEKKKTGGWGGPSRCGSASSSPGRRTSRSRSATRRRRGRRRWSAAGSSWGPPSPCRSSAAPPWRPRGRPSYVHAPSIFQ